MKSGKYDFQVDFYQNTIQLSEGDKKNTSKFAEKKLKGEYRENHSHNEYIWNGWIDNAAMHVRKKDSVFFSVVRNNILVKPTEWLWFWRINNSHCDNHTHWPQVFLFIQLRINMPLMFRFKQYFLFQTIFQNKTLNVFPFDFSSLPMYDV